MPFGSSMVLPYVVEMFYPAPKMLLDIGVGFGINGALARQYTYPDWKNAGHSLTTIGLEPFAEYKTPLWETYSYISDMDVADWIDNPWKHDFTGLNGWDVILMTDVIEHLEKDDGIARLKQLQKRLAPGGRFLVSTPAIWMEQGAAYGNEYERHRSLWTCDDFRSLGFAIEWDGTPQRGQQMIVAVYRNAA